MAVTEHRTVAPGEWTGADLYPAREVFVPGQGRRSLHKKAKIWCLMTLRGESASKWFDEAGMIDFLNRSCTT
tara:strand:+ start:261 stop:476 length:216 start_codon:yes stop_codon:yes gene_type:complete